eukprot:730-Heterococcus_DN1.PRE.3
MVATHCLNIYQACDQAHTMIVVAAGVHSNRMRVVLRVFNLASPEPLDFSGLTRFSQPRPRLMEELMVSECDCSCIDLESAAASVHLHCLRKHWSLRSGVDAKLGKLLLHKVVEHKQQPSQHNTEHAEDARDCSGCLSFLLEAGVELSSDARSSWSGKFGRMIPNALCSVAAAGCVSCLVVMLEKLKLPPTAPLVLWKQAVGEASSHLKLDTLRVLLDAAPDDWLTGLQQTALMRVCNSATSVGNDAKSSEFYAEAQSIIQHLLERQADVNVAHSCQLYLDHYAGSQNEHEYTALGCITKNGCIKAVRWLIDVAGADVNITWGNDQHTVLHDVGTRNSRNVEELINTLVSLGADVNKLTSTGATVLHAAVQSSNLPALKAFVAISNSGQYTSGLTQSEVSLLARQDHEGHTALHTVLLKDKEQCWPCDSNQLLTTLLTCDDSGLLQALVKQDSTGKTVLHLAVQLRQLDKLQQLLAVCERLEVLDCVMNIADNAGQTVITLVRCMGGDDLKAIIQPHYTQFFTSRHDAVTANLKQQTPFHLIDHRTAPLCHELTATLLTALTAEAATTLVNTVDSRGNTALHGIASCELDADGEITDFDDDSLAVCHTCVRALLAVGADPATKNKAGAPAVAISDVLTVAFSENRKRSATAADECQTTVQALQHAGVDINVTHHAKYSEYHLHSAAGDDHMYNSAAAVRLLLDCGADVMLLDANGWTAMQCAAYYEAYRDEIDGTGNAAIIQMLYDAGGHELLQGTTPSGQTVLHLAEGWTESIQKLCELGAHVEERNTSYQTPLHYVSAYGGSECVRALLEHGANIHTYGRALSPYESTGGWLPLHYAVLGAADINTVDTLLTAGAAIDDTTTTGCTAAWLVARYGGARSVKTQLKQLFSKGADLMHYSEQHGSLLHAAAGNGDVAIIKHLLKKGLTLSSSDKMYYTSTKQTPLHCAAQGGHIAIVQLLLDKGCSATDADTDGNTALRLCLQRPKDDAKCFTVLTQAGADALDINEDTRSTLLHIAARHDRPDCIPLLLNRGVDVTALDSEGRSALQLACLYSNTKTVQLLFDSGGWIDSLAAACMLNATINGNTDTLTLLLKRGISCSNVIDDDSGYTLLHAAATYGRLEGAGMLIRHGYAATTLSVDGVSAVDVAFAVELPKALAREGIAAESWAACKPTALLLLQNGCDYDLSKVVDNEMYAALITQYLNELREHTTRQQEILQVYTVNTYTISSANTNEYNNSSQSEDVDSTLQIQSVHADSGLISAQVYTLDTTLLAKLHVVTARQSSSILLNMLVPTYGWGISNVNSSNTDIKLISYDGSDFTEEGFASIIEYLYTGSVVGVTCDILDCDKVQATLQAAQYFNLPTLDKAARSWAQTSGVTVAA